MMVRMHKPQIKGIDAWIGDSGLSRPEAIRQLVNFALDHTKPKQEAPPVDGLQDHDCLNLWRAKES